MKTKLLSIFLMILFFNYSFSQKQEESFQYVEQKNLLDNSYKYSLNNKSIDSLLNVIKSDKLTDTRLYSLAYAMKASLLSKIYKDKITSYSKGFKADPQIVDEILGSYKTAIDSSEDCKLTYLADRMKFLKQIKDTTGVYKSDLKMLKKEGYREEFGSLDFGINFFKGKDYWLGGEISLVNYNGERWKSKGQSGLKTPIDIPFKIGFFNVNYLRNIATADSDFSFSLFKLASPLFLNITKFGFQKCKETGANYWYYRPEIGLGWGAISVYYSYNCMLEKELPPVYEKHLINLSLVFPLIKWK